MPDTNPIEDVVPLTVAHLMLALIVGPVIFGGLLVLAVFVKKYFNL